MLGLRFGLFPFVENGKDSMNNNEKPLGEEIERIEATSEHMYKNYYFVK